MSDFVEPSPSTAESYQMSGAVRYARSSTDDDSGWVAENTVDYYAAEAGASGTPLNAFGESHSSTSMTVTIDTGEGFVSGKWLARDTTTDYTLDASTNNQTLYVGWPAGTGNSVTIGKGGDFATNHGKVEIWTFDTDSNGVTSSTDERDIGEPNYVDTTHDVVASGEAALSGGSAIVDTGLSATDATFMLALGIDDPNADAKIAGQLFWDDSAGTYKVEFVEQETNENPTANYDIIRVS